MRKKCLVCHTEYAEIMQQCPHCGSEVFQSNYLSITDGDNSAVSNDDKSAMCDMKLNKLSKRIKNIKEPVVPVRYKLIAREKMNNITYCNTGSLKAKKKIVNEKITELMRKKIIRKSSYHTRLREKKLETLRSDNAIFAINSGVFKSKFIAPENNNTHMVMRDCAETERSRERLEICPPGNKLLFQLEAHRLDALYQGHSYGDIRENVVRNPATNSTTHEYRYNAGNIGRHGSFYTDDELSLRLGKGKVNLLGTSFPKSKTNSRFDNDFAFIEAIYLIERKVIPNIQKTIGNTAPSYRIYITSSGINIGTQVCLDEKENVRKSLTKTMMFVLNIQTDGSVKLGQGYPVDASQIPPVTGNIKSIIIGGKEIVFVPELKSTYGKTIPCKNLKLSEHASELDLTGTVLQTDKLNYPVGTVGFASGNGNNCFFHAIEQALNPQCRNIDMSHAQHRQYQYGRRQLGIPDDGTMIDMHDHQNALQRLANRQNINIEIYALAPRHYGDAIAHHQMTLNSAGSDARTVRILFIADLAHFVPFYQLP